MIRALRLAKHEICKNATCGIRQPISCQPSTSEKKNNGDSPRKKKKRQGCGSSQRKKTKMREEKWVKEGRSHDKESSTGGVQSPRFVRERAVAHGLPKANQSSEKGPKQGKTVITNSFYIGRRADEQGTKDASNRRNGRKKKESRDRTVKAKTILRNTGNIRSGGRALSGETKRD